MTLSALRPRAPRYAALPGPEGIDASLAYVIACWPVLDPLARYKMAKANGMEDHVAAHHAYWPDEAAQADWYEGLGNMLIDELRAKPPDTEVWTWVDDKTANFVGRRAANDLAVYTRNGRDFAALRGIVRVVVV